MNDTKRSRKEILDSHAKAIKEAREAGDAKRVERLVDELPVLGAWHRRGQ